MWNDVTVNEFIEILELTYEELTPTERRLEAIAIVTGDSFDDLYEDEIDELLEQYSWLDKQPQYKGELPAYNKLSMGSLISLVQFSDKPFENIDKICSLLYHYEDFQQGCDKIRDEFVPMYYHAVNAWLDYFAKFRENYDDLFSSGDDDEEDNEADEVDKVQQRWAWLRIVWELVKGDITKADKVLEMPHLMVFNWITMVKDLKLNRPATGNDLE